MPTQSSLRVPSYRKHSQRQLGMVALPDAATGRRRVYYLGTYGSVESREKYHRLIAEWEAAGRRHPDAERQLSQPKDKGPTINEVAWAYWEAQKPGSKPSTLSGIKQTTRIICTLFGTFPANKFSPNKLRVVRDAMITGDRSGARPRRPWSRSTVNKRVFQIVGMFRWAASHEMLPVSVYQALATVESLRRGKTMASDPLPTRPVSLDVVNVVEPHVSRQIWALIQLQLLTGARGGELFRLRPKDINRTDPSGVWTYTPAEHKTAHLGHDRTIYFGPKAQIVLKPFLLRPDDACLFSPAEAEKERHEQRHAERCTPLSCGNRPGMNRARTRKRPPGECYTKDSYCKAIQRACQQAFAIPQELARRKVRGGKKKALRWERPSEWRQRLGPEGWAELRKWRREHIWHPHQLRHTAATLIRRQFGLEAAQVVLGHSSALVTEATYAERDHQKIKEVMLKIG